MDQNVTLMIVHSEPHAQVIREHLQSKGIDCLINEDSKLIRECIEVSVKKKDYSEARKYLRGTEQND